MNSYRPFFFPFCSLEIRFQKWDLNQHNIVKSAQADFSNVLGSHRLEVASRLDFLKLKLRLVGGDIV